MSYTLSDKRLRNYARIMVHFAPNRGAGIKKGETVYLLGNESAKPLFMAIYTEIVAAGGHVLPHYLPDEFDRFHVNREMAMRGDVDQLNFFPEPYYKGLVESMDHHIVILSTADMKALEGTPPGNSTLIVSAMMNFYEMRNEKVADGKCSWTMCHYGTPAAAAEAGLSEEDYWQQIIKACYLDDEDPIATWKRIQEEIGTIRAKLDALEIEKLHIVGDDVDLHLTIGKDRRWLGGSGQNIPSFEIFTSPDWRGTNGNICFNQPLYYLGKRISGIILTFKDGVVANAEAAENEDALLSMLAVEDANKLGEFSLTDRRHSQITHFMANTLFDENTGGEFGNTHVAVGRSFIDAFAGDTKLPKHVLHEHFGLNRCMKVHTDMISTTNRTVTATLQNGKQVVIYENGQFTI